jgi:glycosyltransferase involved in cell wall biosynthesis
MGLEIQLIEASDPRLSGGAQWARSMRKLQKFDPQLVHADFGWLHGALSVLGGLNPLRAVPSFKQRAKIWLPQALASRAAGVIAVKEGPRSRLPERLRSEPVVIPAGIACKEFRPLDQSQARRSLGFPFDIPLVFFAAGRYAGIKRRQLALSASHRLRAAVPTARLIELNGDVSHGLMPLYYASSDLLLFTSSSEGSPNVVKEAMACELPIGTVDVGDVDWLTRGASMVRIVEADPQRIVAAASSLLMGARINYSRQIAAERFSVDLTARRILDVYRRVMDACRVT